MATVEVPNPTDGAPTEPEMQTEQQDDAEITIDLPLKFIADLYDASSHCKEPENHHELEEKFEDAIKADLEARGVDATTDSERLKAGWREYPYYKTQYVVDFDKNGIPLGHKTWLPEFQMKIQQGETEDGRPTGYFQVFESQDEAELVLNTEEFKRSRDFDLPGIKYPPQEGEEVIYIWAFGKKYPFGAAMFDKNMKPLARLGAPGEVGVCYKYAEHAHIGDNITLQWPDKECKGVEPLKLENGKSLSYGQINALGAREDQNLTQQIIDNRQHEVDLVQETLNAGNSVHDLYKGPALRKRASDAPLVERVIGKENGSLLNLTMNGKGPSYIRLLQLNFDHFGNDAKLAYNAGHTCALQAAAKGDLNLAYTLNAFADHFLGDQFAAGHLRTPRRILHGNDADVAAGINVALEALDEYNINMQDITLKNGLNIGKAAFSLVANSKSKVWNTIKGLAPDLCSKYMHDEDNYLGLYVTNRRGDKWRAYGDSKMFEASNKTNKDMMKECLQASADEVYEAYKTKNIISPDQFVAWTIAPCEVLPGNHAPLFDSRGWVRKELGNPKCREYVDPKTWRFKWVISGFAGLVFSLNFTDAFSKY
ncbi:hypothetical protein TWF730_002534 [Orbilia blumenaviensis]|uniref:Uncharacterized protein n=1 Tax=Orbilia blumenaviensis TaxID=1796055 RepID=A0AAV9UD78_9PEZI